MPCPFGTFRDFLFVLCGKELVQPVSVVCAKARWPQFIELPYVIVHAVSFTVRTIMCGFLYHSPNLHGGYLPTTRGATHAGMA